MCSAQVEEAKVQQLGAAVAAAAADVLVAEMQAASMTYGALARVPAAFADADAGEEADVEEDECTGNAVDVAGQADLG